jgi:NarL family two-component system sensor histidine kinase LiaS
MTHLEKLMQAVRRLQWKLTLSYTTVTLGALLVSILILTVLMLSTIFIPYDMAPKEMWVQAANEQAVPIARMLLSESPPNMDGIAELVNYSDAARFESLDLMRFGNVALYIRATADIEMLIFDPNGSLLGRTGFPAFSGPGQKFDPSTIPKLESPLQAALAGVQDADRLVSSGGPGEAWGVAVPVFDSVEGSDRLLGAVAYVLKSMPTDDEIISHTVKLVSGSILLFLVAAGIMGTIFGHFTARGMVKRLERLSDATDAWSQGDFSQFIHDSNGDEISQLAGRMDSMAGQLQNLLKRRQEMAISEERNRLARELHDSAKQQALAASFQLGTAITLYEREPQSAKQHLLEADNLVDSVRKELTDLIYELRPPTQNGSDFVQTLNEWAHQNEISVNVNVEGYKESSLEIEGALYRVVQEALANIARHSSAGSADVSLVYGSEAVTLTIVDDGRGFDINEQHNGMGLHSMQERAESLSGDFVIESGLGHGTRISVTMPAA